MKLQEWVDMAESHVENDANETSPLGRAFGSKAKGESVGQRILNGLVAKESIDIPDDLNVRVQPWDDDGMILARINQASNIQESFLDVNPSESINAYSQLPDVALNELNALTQLYANQRRIGGWLTGVMASAGMWGAGAGLVFGFNAAATSITAGVIGVGITTGATVCYYGNRNLSNVREHVWKKFSLGENTPRENIPAQSRLRFVLHKYYNM